jgi:DNA-binding winged helix-turn-helix (wHTH) protein
LRTVGSPSRKPRYVFADFVLSPSRRTLAKSRSEVALIPRYFDLLVLLVERRNEAVTRREIFDTVWSDVVVSDGALSQAVRTLRRALGDDPREPAFIRTVSRHGYRFVFPEVVEQSDEEVPPIAVDASSPARAEPTGAIRPSYSGDPPLAVSPPMPADPFTGKPFRYELKDGTAHIRGTPPAGEARIAAFNLHYEITIRK